jgi:hypothetical protein
VAAHVSAGSPIFTIFVLIVNLKIAEPIIPGIVVLVVDVFTITFANFTELL